MAHGFSVQGGLGAGASIIPHESSAHSVLVPDTELLFTAQFHRAGPDLVLTGRDGQHHLIPGYFASEHHPALVAPNGAHLSPDTVDLLAGSATPGHYAQAQPTTPPDSIGKIEKVVGDVSVVRNGATVALHVGDAVFKSDVVQTGAGASCGISFPDGTVLNLVANTRMALNDYAYDANSNANGALFTLVEGTFAFVAGKVAHSGDMKIATPVATMGIRGTTGVVQEQPDTAATITANAGGHTYTFAVVPDIGTGITGMWDVYLTDANGIIQRDANGNPIVLVTVSQSGYVTYLTPQGLGQPPLVSTEPATNSQYAFEQDMLQQLFRTLNPANLNGNGNNGSSTPPPPFEQPNPIPQLFEDSGKPFTINVPNGSSTPTPTIIDIVTGPTGPLTVVIWIAGGSGPWSSGASWLGGAPPTSPQEVEILNPVKVTTDGADSAAGLVINAGATLNIVSGTSFTIYDFIHGGGTIALNSSGSDPTLFVHGGVTLVGGGTIKMLGPTGEDNILGVSGTGAALVNIDYTIEGTGTIGGGDGNLTFQNFGTVNANDGFLTINTGNVVANNGLMEATVGATLAIDDGVSNVGTIKADGAGSAVTFNASVVTNLAGGTINATNAGTVTFEHGSVANAGMLEATAGGILQLENITVTNSGAGELSIVGASSELDLMHATVQGGLIENCGKVVVTAGSSILHGDTVTNSGTMTVEAGASLTLEGDTTLINERHALIEADGDGAKVIVNIDTDENVNSGTIKAIDGGEVDFNINIDGGSNHGLIEAGAGGTVHFFQTNHGGGGGGGGGGNQGGNYGTMEAADGGVLIFDGGLDNFCRVEAVDGGIVDLKNGVNNHDGGQIESSGACSQVNVSGGDTSKNCGTIIAEHHGAVTFTSVMLVNADNGDIGTGSSGTITIDCSNVVNCGSIGSSGNGAITIAYSNVCNNGEIGAETGGTITFEHSHIVNNNHIGTGDNLGPSVGPIGTIIFDHSYVVNNGGFDSGHNGEIDIDCSTIDNTNGTIQSGGPDGGNSSVQLSSATIIGGTLATLTGGIIETVADSGISTLSGVTIDDGSILKADTGSSLDLECTTTLDGTVTFEGCGTFVLDPGVASIVGGADGGTLDIAVGATLTGSGEIGNAGATALALSNSGTVDADGVGAEIDIETANYTVTNKGLLEATKGGTLAIESDVNNDCGTIGASGAGSTVQLVGGINIAGGTLTTGSRSSASDGVIEIVAVAAAETILNGSAHAVTIDGYVRVDAGASLALDGTIDNEGTIDLASACGPSTNLVIQTDVTLQGGGQVTLTDCGESAIGTNGSPVTLTNVDNTISGAGTIGDRTYLTLVNQHDGTVDANICGATLTIDTSNTASNAGLLEATHGGTLEIDDKVCNTACGVISASGHGSVVQLDGVTIIGGTLETSNGGVIDTTGTSTLSNVTIADGSTLEAGSGATFLLEGTTTVSDPVIFKGCGTFELSGKGAAIVGSGDDADLHNYATISGAGTIGSVDLSLTNECSGVIDATGHLSINLSSNHLTNDGTMEATCGGELTLLSPVINYGVIAAYAGSTVYIGNEVSNEAIGQVSGEVIASGHCAVVDLLNATIIGGTVESDKGGLIQTVTGADDTPTTSALEDVTIGCGSDIKVVDQTTLILEAGTTMSGGRLSIESSGDVEIVNGGGAGGATLTDVNLQNCGEITVDSDTTLTLSGTTVHGGAIDGADASGCVIASTIDVTGDSAFCGVHLSHGDLTVEGGFTLTLNGGTICDVAIEDGTVTSCGVIAGTIDVTGDATFTNTNLHDGNLTVESGVTLSVEGDATTTTFDGVHVTDSGTIQVDEPLPRTTLLLENATTISGGGTLSIGGTGILDVEGGATLDGLTVNVCSGGIIEVGETTSGSILTLDDGTTVSGGGTGQLTINFGNTLDVEKGTSDCHNGATLDGVVVQDNGAIDIGHAATGAILTLDDGTTINGGGSAALTIHAGSTLDVENGPHGGGATLDDVHVTDCGAFDIGDVASGAILTLQDDATITGGGIGMMTIHANNTVDVETSTNGGATLDGVQVTDNGAFDIGDVAPCAILTLDDGTTVGGCGAMTINAGNTLDVNGGTTTINLGGTITNNGTLEASGGGTLDIVSHVDNGSGTLLATSGGVLDIESAICGGAATIHAATLEFDASSNVNVTFDNGDSGTDYGLLILKDGVDFSGTISGFSGTAPNAANSDEVELAGFVKTSCSIQDCGDNQILTLTDANGDVVTLKFINFDDTLTVTTDGDNTYIYDPPAAGAKDAPATATTAASNEHTAAPTHQNGVDSAASPANPAGFGGDQDSTAAATPQDGAATPPANQLALAGDTVTAPPAVTSALGGNDLAGFGDDPATTSGGVHSGAVTMQLTAVTPPIAAVTPNTPVLASEHLTDSTFVDGSDIAKSEVTPAVPSTPPGNEHISVPALATSPAPAASPTLASASFGGLGNDSFAFHQNLGSDTAQTTDAHANEIAHSNLQIAGSAPAAIAPEFHQEFAFDAIHQDIAAVAATVDQFHQMAANTTLLH